MQINNFIYANNYFIADIELVPLLKTTMFCLFF